MVFSGNPGTGKLTVAKMLGEIYYSAGILSRPTVVVQHAKNLRGNGNIPPEQVVLALMNAAEGGILYLENAASFWKMLRERLISKLFYRFCLLKYMRGLLLF